MTFDEYSASPSAREKMALFSAKRKRNEKIILYVILPLLALGTAFSIAGLALDAAENRYASLSLTLSSLACFCAVLIPVWMKNLLGSDWFLKELYPAEKLFARDKLSAFFEAFPKEGSVSVQISFTKDSLVLQVLGGETFTADISFFSGALRLSDGYGIFMAGYFPLMDEKRSRGYFLNELKIVPADGTKQSKWKKEKDVVYLIKKSKLTMTGKRAYSAFQKAEERYAQTKLIEK